MGIRDQQAALWFDEWIWLDDQSTSTWAHTWRLPPEKWLNLGNSVQAQFIFDYWASGPGAGNLNIGVEQSPHRTLDDDCWHSLSYPSNFALSRIDDSVGRIVGQDGSPYDNYPRGWGRVMVKNSATTPNDWAAIRLRCMVRLLPA